jgi:hypothetical protein
MTGAVNPPKIFSNALFDPLIASKRFNGSA